MRTVAGVFPSEIEAEKTKGDLKSLGISGEEIIVAGGDAECMRRAVSADRNMAAAAASGAGWLLAGIIRAVVTRRSAAAGAAVGAVVGATFGAVGGMITHLTWSSPIAHLNVFLVELGAVAIGALAGAVLAWTYGMGVSHEGVAFCAEAAREHGIVVAAHVREEIEPDAMRVMTEHGAANVRADADPWRASGWSGPHPDDQNYPSDSSLKAHEMPE